MTPEKTTGRTTYEIVEAVEARLYAHIITSDRECSADCRCVRCWHKALDALIQTSEAAVMGLDCAQT